MLYVPFGDNRKVQGRDVWEQNRERLLLVKVSYVPIEEKKAENLRKPEGHRDLEGKLYKGSEERKEGRREGDRENKLKEVRENFERQTQAGERESLWGEWEERKKG